MVGMAECYSMAGRSKTSRSDAGNRRKLAMANLCQDTSSNTAISIGVPHLFKSMGLCRVTVSRRPDNRSEVAINESETKVRIRFDGALHSLGTDWRLPQLTSAPDRWANVFAHSTMAITIAPAAMSSREHPATSNGQTARTHLSRSSRDKCLSPASLPQLDARSKSECRLVSHDSNWHIKLGRS